MPDALRAHGNLRDSPMESLVGPLLVPASAMEQLRKLADPNALTSIALVADTGLDGAIAARNAIQDDAWLELVHIEVRLPPTDDPELGVQQLLPQLPFTVPVYIELPADPDVTGGISALSADGAERAKLRCGPENVPSITTVSSFIYSCVAERVPFKLTGGLHRALPHDVDDGPAQHGFLNTLAATWAAIDGADLDAVASVLASRDSELVLGVLDPADIEQLRNLYRSFGSCSIDEPFQDLVDLRLLSEVR